MVGVPVEAADFDPAKVPDHLKITFRVIDERRRKLAEDKDLEALRLKLKPKTRAAISKAFEQAAERPAGDRKGGAGDGRPRPVPSSARGSRPGRSAACRAPSRPGGPASR